MSYVILKCVLQSVFSMISVAEWKKASFPAHSTRPLDAAARSWNQSDPSEAGKKFFVTLPRWNRNSKVDFRGNKQGFHCKNPNWKAFDKHNKRTKKTSLRGGTHWQNDKLIFALIEIEISALCKILLQSKCVAKSICWPQKLVKTTDQLFALIFNDVFAARNICGPPELAGRYGPRAIH